VHARITENAQKMGDATVLMATWAMTAVSISVRAAPKTRVSASTTNASASKVGAEPVVTSDCVHPLAKAHSFATPENAKCQQNLPNEWQWLSMEDHLTMKVVVEVEAKAEVKAEAEVKANVQWAKKVRLKNAMGQEHV